MSKGTGRSATVRRFSRDTLEFVYHGHVTAADVSLLLIEYRRLHREQAELYHLVDVTGVTHVDPRVGEFVGEILREFVANGGKESVVAACDGLVRMRAVSVGVSVQVPLRVMPSRAEAILYIESVSQR